MLAHDELSAPGPAGGLGNRPRPLAIRCVQLACCAIESANGVEQWLATSAESNAATSGDSLLNVLVVAGTVTHINEDQVVTAYENLSEPRVVVAFGVCAISGGPYWDSYAVRPGIEGLVPVDYYIPGCPPSPTDLARVLDQIAESV